jgi:hypothetical protein
LHHLSGHCTTSVLTQELTEQAGLLFNVFF